jgi:hypothetical protein
MGPPRELILNSAANTRSRQVDTLRGQVTSDRGCQATAAAAQLGTRTWTGAVVWCAAALACLRHLESLGFALA